MAVYGHLPVIRIVVCLKEKVALAGRTCRLERADVALEVLLLRKPREVEEELPTDKDTRHIAREGILQIARTILA